MSNGLSSQRRSFIRRALAALCLPLAFAASSSALAQAPARFLVPFSAGGAADGMARVLVEKLREELKQTIVIENRPGASTRVAAELLKQAPGDGNTVLMTLMDTMVIAPLVYSNLRYDPQKDFSPISEVATVTYGLAVNAKQPHRNLQDFLKAAKADPNKATVGTTGLGSTLHFLAVDLARNASTDLSIVPFHGGPSMMTNLLGDQIAGAIDGLGVFVEQHKAQKVRVLAVSGQQRASQLPDVPTFAESGFPALVASSSYALYAPAGTPEAQINRWNQALRKVLSMPEVRARIQSIGYEPTRGSTPAEVTQALQRALAHWEPIVKATKYKGD